MAESYKVLAMAREESPRYNMAMLESSEGMVVTRKYLLSRMVKYKVRYKEQNEEVRRKVVAYMV